MTKRRKIHISAHDPRKRYKHALLMGDLYFSRWAMRGTPTGLPILRMTTDDNVYRIELKGDRQVEVLCFGLESVDTELEGYYDSVEALPKWVQERIALLSMIDAKPPTEEVENVGRRINQSTYWVYKPIK